MIKDFFQLKWSKYYNLLVLFFEALQKSDNYFGTGQNEYNIVS